MKDKNSKNNLTARYSTTDRLGVNETERIFLSEFNWIFREQPIVDVGIDAIVEQSENGNPKGKFIALQIKSGKGNFHISENKITYYISNVHYSYWLNFDIPIILIVHFPESRETYWQEITEKKIKRTKKKWKLEIPKKNKLNNKAKPKLKRLLIDKNSNSSTLKIFNGEKLYKETIYDIYEKINCISDATTSTIETVRILKELTKKMDESGEIFRKHNENGKNINSSEVIASIRGYSKNLTIYSRRLESENQIFAETFGEGIFAFEQIALINSFLDNDEFQTNEFLKNIESLSISFDETIDSFVFMKKSIKELQNIKVLKEGKKNILSVVELMINEYKIAKEISLNIISKIKNNC